MAERVSYEGVNLGSILINSVKVYTDIIFSSWLPCQLIGSCDWYKQIIKLEIADWYNNKVQHLKFRRLASYNVSALCLNAQLQRSDATSCAIAQLKCFNCMINQQFSSYNAKPHPAIMQSAALWFNSYCSTVCSTDTVQLNAQRNPTGHNLFTIVYCLESSCTSWACTRTRIPSSRQIRHKVVDQ